LAQLPDTHWRHANDTSRTKAKQGSKDVQGDNMITKRKPDEEHTDEGKIECQNHGIKSPITITEPARERPAKSRATVFILIQQIQRGEVERTH
jgi:hypothetical protein